MSGIIQPINPASAIVILQPLSVAAANRDAGQTESPLANLPAGSDIEGFVINRDAHNNPVLRTPLGDFVVASSVFLKTGSKVELRVDPSQTSRARITRVDGLTLEDYARTNTHGLTEDTIVAPQFLKSGQTQPSPAASSSTTTNVGETSAQQESPPVLNAVVLNATDVGPSAVRVTLSPSPTNAPADPLPPQLANLPPGTPLQLTVVDVELPPRPISLAALKEVKLPENLFAQPLPPATPISETTHRTPVPAASPSLTSVSAHTSEAPSTAASLPPQEPVSLANTQPTTPLAPNSARPVSATPALNTPQALATPLIAQEVLNTQTVPAEQGTVPASVVPGASFRGGYVTPPQLRTPSPPPSTAASVSTTPSLTNIPASAPPAIQNTLLAQAVLPNVSDTAPLIDTPPAPPTLPTLRATVIGHEADGANILQTPFASIKLYTNQPLPTGTTLLVQAQVDGHAKPADTRTGAEPLAPITHFNKQWPALSEALVQLQQENPSIAARVAQQIPTLDRQFTNTALFFLSAVKSGKLRDWLGNHSVNQIAAIAPSILSKLEGDLEIMQQTFAHSPLTQWSTLTLPFLFGQEMQQLRLYIRGDEHKEGREENAPRDSGKRFIVEVNLSQIGDLQLDGFVRGGEKIKSFDLIIRANSGLTSEIRGGIQTVFAAALSETNLTGQLTFQQGVEHFVRPLASIQPPASGESPQPILA